MRYDDPFLRRWLYTPMQLDEPVLGLRGFLEAYGVNENTPVILFLHIICPNIEHSEFSKTEINHLPFRQALSEILSKLLQTFRQRQEEEELQLEQTIFRALDTILKGVGEEERFVLDQLIGKLQGRLSQESSLVKWLQAPDVVSRLREYVSKYKSHSIVLTQRVARPLVGTLSIPIHPNRHFSVSTEHLSSNLLEKHHVNKILYIQIRELEPVIVENNWLCRMDMALLQGIATQDEYHHAVIQCIINSNVPILLVHDATEEGQALVKQTCSWLDEKQLDVRRVIDIGLYLPQRRSTKTQLTKLVEMMPGELADWLIAQFRRLNIPIKQLPPESNIRQDISRYFEKLLLGHVWEGVSQQLRVSTCPKVSGCYPFPHLLTQCVS